MTEFKRRFTWFITAGLLALLLAASVSIPAVEADGPPGLPHTFYGNVSINGLPAAAGTAVAAYVGSTLSTSATVDSSGRYGYSPVFWVSGTDGQTVSFYVGGSLAPQTYTFQTGGITQLNLVVSTTSLNVSTSAATGVSSMVASLNGNLNNLGGFSSASVYFQYGTTTSYGGTSSTQTMTSGGPFSAAISGLTPLTTYYFRAVATGGSTTVYGSPLTFITTVSTLSVSSTAASGVAVSSATLNGNLNDKGLNSSVSVFFQYGPSIYYGYTTTAQARSTTGAFSAGISSLVAGSTYHYRAVAQGTTTVYGEDTAFSTPTGTLSVETNAATAIGANSATLNGTLTSLGGTSSGSVYFQYGTTISYGSATAPQARSSGGAFSASISGLSAVTPYNFRAVAQVGSSTVYGSNLTFTTSSGSGGGTAPPHMFYGRVLIDGVLAAAGTPVAAYVNGIPAASTTTDSSGNYGWTTLFQVSGGPGTVTFYVNNTLVPQTATWTSGGMTSLNLVRNTPSGLSVTTSSLPNGTIGSSYSATLQATGGTSPYTWSMVTGGLLPAGLTLASSGLISGTPTTNGLSSFTVQVSDSASSPSTATRALSICIGGSCGTPPPGGMLLGTGATGTGTGGLSLVRLVKFTASGTGNVSQIRVYSLVGGNVKVALYADSAGAPGSLLNANNTSTACTAGQWNTISLTATPVTAGIAYWIGVADETGAGACYSYTSPILMYWTNITYSSYVFPNPAGSGYTISSPWYMAFTGY